jgi:3-hydroxy acid dehydrogenase / malonic semialdehyde reductase
MVGWWCLLIERGARATRDKRAAVAPAAVRRSAVTPACLLFASLSPAQRALPFHLKPKRATPPRNKTARALCGNPRRSQTMEPQAPPPPPPPRLLVLCGPVGAGKRALARLLRDQALTPVRLITPRELLELEEKEENVAAANDATPTRVVVLSATKAQSLRHRRPGLPATYVFVSPASLAELEASLRGRGRRTDGEEEEEEDSDEGDEGHREGADATTTTPAANPDDDDDGEDESERLERLLSLARRELAAVVESPQDFDYVLAAGAQQAFLAAAQQQLERIARRARRGLGAERRGASGEPLQILGPGGVEVVVEDEEEGVAAATAAAAGTTPTTMTAAAAAAAAAEAPPPPPHPPAQAFISPELAALRGKVALVTGASSGIGRACAKQLHAAGMRVAAVARRADRLAALGRELLEGSDGGGGAPAAASSSSSSSSFLALPADVSSEQDVGSLLPRIREAWGSSRGGGAQEEAAAVGVDVLVHVAGLARDDARIFDGNPQAWRQMCDVNLLGTCLMFRAVVGDMSSRGKWGHVVSLTGLTSIRCPDPHSGGAFFAATKMAMRMCTEGLRREARERGVPLRVSAVSPGLVDTEFFAVRATEGRGGGRAGAAVGAAARERVLASSLPKGEPPLLPDDVARCVLYCLTAPAHVEVNDVVVRPRGQAV